MEEATNFFSSYIYVSKTYVSPEHWYFVNIVHIKVQLRLLSLHKNISPISSLSLVVPIFSTVIYPNTLSRSEIISQGYGFSSSHVWMQKLDSKESWVLKNWCFSTVMLEKTPESPLDCKEIQPVHPEGDQSWVFIGRTDVETETPILWPPDVKHWFIWKDLDAGKDWGQEEKGTREDEIVGWHHRLNGHGFGWTLGVGDGQGGLACCSSWGHKDLDTTEPLNWTEWLM